MRSLLQPLRRLREHDKAIGDAVAEHAAAAAERQAVVEELRQALADAGLIENGHAHNGHQKDSDDADPS